MSFQKLWESMHELEHEDKGLSVIRTGIGIDEDFWSKFLLVINNSEGLSQLLDVPVTKISLWNEKIKHALEKVEKNDSSPEVSGNSKLLKTGLPN